MAQDKSHASPDPDPDRCPDCGVGHYDRTSGVASLPSECCAVYFYGAGSWAHGQWVAHRRASAP
jgi:hypothetical protein